MAVKPTKTLDNLLSTFAERVEEARDRADLTQAQLAAAAGVGRGSISRWERSESLPSSHDLAALCLALDLSADHLLFKDVPQAPRGFITDPDALRLLQALPRLSPDARTALMTVLDALITKQAMDHLLD